MSASPGPAPARRGLRRAVPRSRRGRLAAAAALGAALTLAQPPVSAWPAVFAAAPLLGALLFRAPPREAFGIGWAAGAGFFITGLYWIAEAFLVDVARHGWMIPFALPGLAAGLGLFWGAAFLAARRSGAGGFGAALALAAALALIEYARAHVLTGFPWALPAYALAQTPVAQAGALFGPHALGFLLLAAALAPAAPWLHEGARPPLGAALRRATTAAAVAGCALAAGWGWGAVRVDAAPVAAADAPLLRLVQPNVPQREKWDPARIPAFFARLRALSAPDDGPAPDVVVWPEAAVPYLLDRDPEARRLIAESAGGAPVLLGVRRVAEGPDGRPEWRNAMSVVDASGAVVATYDKHHLVPFGEYVPFHALLARLGLGPMVGESGGFRPGPGPRVLRVADLPAFAPQICYETIFPHEMPGPRDRPEWIVQVTNDAWFGATAGPWQHFHQARMRAIEQGLPVARAANTGVSAIIDAHGRTVASLGLDETGAVQARLPPAAPPTLYALTGDAPWIAAIAAALALCALSGRRAREGGRPA